MYGNRKGNFVTDLSSKHMTVCGLTLTPRSLSASLFGRVTSEASDTAQVHTQNRTLWPCEVGKPCRRK